MMCGSEFMKIGILTSWMRLGWGVDLVLHQLATRLVERGHRVRIFTGMTDGSFGDTAYEMVPVPVKPHKVFAIFEWNARRWIKYFNQRDEDIFLIATQPFFYFPKFLKKPCVSMEFGIVDTRGFSWRKRANFAYMRLTQYYIYHRYAGRIISNSKYTCSLLPPFQRSKCIPIYHGYEHVLPPRGTDRAALRKQFREKFGVSDDDILLLYVGRINPRDQPYKGTAELMQSAVELRGKFPQCRLMMAGIGSDYDVKLCREAGIIPVIEAPQDWMAGLYLAADIYCSASKWEGFNLPLLEAQSFGRPAVAYSIGAHPEVLNDCVTGFLVDSHDEFITRLGDLISSTDLRAEMGRRAAEWAEGFAWDSYTRGCERVLEEVIREVRR
jgi:glycosyltransferase involved in cell wall biosynthesis